MSAIVPPTPITIDQIPLASTQVPPAVSENGAVGTEQMLYALANHTHPSKVRKAKIVTATDGSITWTYKDVDGNNAPFADGVVPIVLAVAETGVGVTDVVNVQVEGVPTNTSAKLRVNRANKSVVALISLTVLSVVTNPGATTIHAIALAP